jgi:hypothetical protein
MSSTQSSTQQHRAKPKKANKELRNKRIYLPDDWTHRQGRAQNRKTMDVSRYVLRHGGLIRAKAAVRERKAHAAERMAAYFETRRERNDALHAQRTYDRTSLRRAAAEPIYPLK